MYTFRIIQQIIYFCENFSTDLLITQILLRIAGGFDRIFAYELLIKIRFTFLVNLNDKILINKYIGNQMIKYN